MHHIHRTSGLILKNFPIKEADKQLNVLTRDFGLTKISVTGARKIQSKHRQSIQDYSLANFAMVKGKMGWKLTSVIFVSNFYKDIEDENLKESLIRVLNLMIRLVPADLPESEIFDITCEFIDFAKQNETELGSSELIQNFETIFLLRILDALGYVETEKFDAFLGTKISLELILKNEKDIISAINQAIRESGL